MLASTTHDTKRSEDVRARIALLSEIPESLGGHGRAMVEAQRAAQARRPARPEPGVPPLPDARRRLADRRVERLVAYMMKACREAKEYTSWHTPEPGLRGGDHRVHAGAPGRRRVPRRPRALRRSAGRAGAGQFPVADPDQADRPGRARPLSGDRALDHEPRRPRQPACRSITRPASGCSASSRGRDDARRRSSKRSDEGLPKLHLIRQALRLRQAPTRLVRPRLRLYADASRRARSGRTSSPSLAAARAARDHGRAAPADPAAGTVGAARPWSSPAGPG